MIKAYSHQGNDFYFIYTFTNAEVAQKAFEYMKDFDELTYHYGQIYDSRRLVAMCGDQNDEARMPQNIFIFLRNIAKAFEAGFFAD